MIDIEKQDLLNMGEMVDQDNPPIFNLPAAIKGLAFVLVGLHIFRIYLLPDEYAQDFILLFAAIPARYGDLGGLIPYSFAAWYTPLTHALIHADWGHLLINLAWLLAFGSPVARRLGTVRFLVFISVCALAGFGFHLATHLEGFNPMLGASGAISGCMGAAIRLQRDVEKPVLGLFQSFKNRGFLGFVLIWFLINLLIGFNPGLIAGEETQIAWQAHIGGFLSGLLLFKFFDIAQPQPG